MTTEFNTGPNAPVNGPSNGGAGSGQAPTGNPNADDPSMGSSTSSSATGEPSAAERAAGQMRDQASAAASAFSRGEFMHDATVDPAADKDDRLIALLSYVTQIFIPLVMPVIVLLSESSKKRPFQRYHAVQSLALYLLFIALAGAVAIGTALLQVIPVVGFLVGFAVLCLSPIAFFMGVIALVYYGAQAYQGKRFSIPGLTSTLRDQGWIE